MLLTVPHHNENNSQVILRKVFPGTYPEASTLLEAYYGDTRLRPLVGRGLVLQVATWQKYSYLLRVFWRGCFGFVIGLPGVLVLRPGSELPGRTPASPLLPVLALSVAFALWLATQEKSP